MKAYRHDDGVYTFRPYANAARMNRSAQRMALPQLDQQAFIQSLEQLVTADKQWVPGGDGEALYLRPFMFATEAFLGVRPAKEISYRVIASTGRQLLRRRELKPVRIWVLGTTTALSRAVWVPRRPAATTPDRYYPSSRPRRRAATRCCSSIRSTTMPLKSFGGMNVFLVPATAGCSPRR